MSSITTTAIDGYHRIVTDLDVLWEQIQRGAVMLQQLGKFAVLVQTNGKINLQQIKPVSWLTIVNLKVLTDLPFVWIRCVIRSPGASATFGMTAVKTTSGSKPSSCRKRSSL